MSRSPMQVWHELQALSLKFRREDHARAYVLQRIWWVLPLALLFFLASAACAVGVFRFAQEIVPPAASPRWLLGPVLFFALVAFFGAIASQLYVLITWLERAAARHPTAPRPGAGYVVPAPRPAFSAGTFIALTVFVALPLVLFGAAYPSGAFLLSASALVLALLYMAAR